MPKPLFPHLLLAPPDASSWTDPAATSRRLHGDVAHQALALLEPGEIAPGKTCQAAVTRRLRQARALLGVHPARLDLAPLASAIVRTLAHPLMAELFSETALALAEQEIVIPAQVLAQVSAQVSGHVPVPAQTHGSSPAAPHTVVRVDRLVLLPDGTAWVLDFKLGVGDPDADRAQVRSYQRLLADLLGRECHGALVNLEQAEVVTLPPVQPRHGATSVPEASGCPISPLPEALTLEALTPEPPDDHGPPPIRVLPLHADPIALLHDHLRARCAESPFLGMANIQVIFPHRRPRIYLHQALARSLGAPFLPPRCSSLEDWILRQACLASDDPPALATPLDQAWLLHEIDADLKCDRESTSWHRFLPWGLRLAQVLDELDRERITAQALDHPPDDLPETAARLLADLGAVQAAFHERLADRNLATPATLAAQIQPNLLPEGPSRPGPSSSLLDGPTYLCGLFALTRTEADLVQALRQAGAELWWQADRPLPEPLRRWAAAWQADLDWEFAPGDPTEPRQPQGLAQGLAPTFILAHDLHSELRRLAEDAASWDQNDRVAVILPDPALLRPVLAHLPTDKEVNVTLGLPLERSALGLLLHTLTRMARDGRLTGVGPGSRDYLDLWQNPWVRRLLPSGGLARLRRLIQGQGHAFLDSAALAELLRACVAVDVENVHEGGQPETDSAGFAASSMVGLAALFHEALDLTTLEELRAFLLHLLDALQVRERAPSVLEMHAVHALYSKVLPDLEQTLSRDHPLPPAALWSVFWNCLGLERIPFSGEPLTPWQVMGLLESRLLCFDKVIVLECVEGVLPRTNAPNPLLPEALRPALGLPPGYAEERIIHSHLRRLMVSAGEVRLYSRQGLSPNPLEGRTMPSRYWERELWDREKAAGRLLHGSVSRVTLELDLSLSPGRPPEKAALAERLARRLERGLSLSALQTYLRCPLRFFKEEVAAFPPRPDPRSDPGAAVMGRLAHDFLERLFRPHVGSAVVPVDLLAGFDDLWAELAPGHLREAPLAPAARFFQARLLQELLRNYLRQSDQPVHLLAVEQSGQRPLSGAAAKIVLRGRLDRIDLDPLLRIPMILDYKTGGASHRKPLDIHRLDDLAGELARLSPEDENAARDGLALINSHLPDPQLPGYLFLHGTPALCGYMHLGEWQAKNRFVPLTKPGKKDEADHLRHRFLDWQEQGLPTILEWIGRHILEAPLFSPTTQPATCPSCPWRITCPWAMEE